MANRPFMPSKADAPRLCLALGFVAFVMAVLQLSYAQTSAPTGRWSWLIRPIYEVFGSVGLAAFFTILGLFLLIIGLRKKGE